MSIFFYKIIYDKNSKKYKTMFIKKKKNSLGKTNSP